MYLNETIFIQSEVNIVRNITKNGNTVSIELIKIKKGNTVSIINIMYLNETIFS